MRITKRAMSEANIKVSFEFFPTFFTQDGRRVVAQC